MIKPLLISLIIITATSCNNSSILYFNQEPPCSTPELFAPSKVNSDSIELNVVFNYDHSEMFFSRIVKNSFIIHHSELINGMWSDIKTIKMYDDSVLVSVACDPTVTKDGKTMYFLGVNPKLYKNDITRKELYTIPPDIYMSKKVDGKWQLASKVDFQISTQYIETYPVVVEDGSLYFLSNRPSDVGGMNTYRAQYLGNEKFKAPVIINTKSDKKELITYVSPDERYAITNGHGKFQITHKYDSGWTKPIEIPFNYDNNWRYYAPYMTADGKYFMYSRRYNNPEKKGWAGVEKGEVYWVNTDVLLNTIKE